MFKQITYDARIAVESRFAWLLVLQNQVLVHELLDCEAPEQANQFTDIISEHYSNHRFPLVANDTILADALLRNLPLIGVHISKLNETNHTVQLYTAFQQIDLQYITLLPLRHDQRPMGLLVLGHDDDSFIRSKRGQNLLKVLRRQLSLELNHNFATTSAKKMYDGLMRAINEPVLVVDDKNQVVHANEQFCRMVETNREQLIGLAVRDVLLSSTQLDEYTVRKETGTLIPVGIRVIPLDIEINQIRINRLLIIENRSLLESHERALEDQTKRLRTLNMASRAINSPIGLQDVIQVVLSSAHEVVSAEAAALLLRDDEDDLIVVATRGMPDMHGRAITMGMGIIGWVAENAEPILINDVAQDPRYRSYVDSTTSILTRSLVAIPLVTTSEVIGVLMVINRSDGDFITEDLEILENLGAAAATAIENATLFDQTNRRLTELSTILDASAMATSTMNLQTIVEHISKRLREALKIQRVNIYTINPDHTLCRLVAVVDSQWQPDKALAIPIERVPTKQQALKQPVRLDVETSKLTEEEISELKLRGTRFALNAPLMFGDQTVGVITIYGQEPFELEQATTTLSKAVKKWETEIDMPAESLGLLCYRVLSSVNARWCTIYLLNNDGNKLLMLQEIGTSFWMPPTGPVLESNWLPTAETVIKGGETKFVSRLTSKPPREKQYQALLGTTHTMLTPIVQHGDVIGIFELAANHQQEFDDSAVSLASGIANIVGNAIESSSLYNSLEQRAEALEGAYHELEQADRLKDELLQNMSHELGTPLTHILGYLSLLEDQAFGPLNPEQTETIAQAVRKTQNVADLVKQMVVVHASNSMNLNLKETRLEQLAALAVRTLVPRAEEMGIEILPRISRNLPAVMVDQVAMSEVFEALIDNALKFSGDGKQIEVEIRDTSGLMVQVAIRDEGIGIPEAEHARVFRQFYQIDGSTTRTYGGMGLGLAIVRKIIDAHGGRVWLESDVGQGTAVFFTVPKATALVGKTKNVFATN